MFSVLRRCMPVNAVPMNSLRALVLFFLLGVALCLTAAPAWADRINRGASGLGNTDCSAALANGQPWDKVTDSAFDIGTNFSSCSPFNGTFEHRLDLFPRSFNPGDSFTLIA